MFRFLFAMGFLALGFGQPAPYFHFSFNEITAPYFDRRNPTRWLDCSTAPFLLPNGVTWVPNSCPISVPSLLGQAASFSGASSNFLYFNGSAIPWGELVSNNVTVSLF